MATGFVKKEKKDLPERKIARTIIKCMECEITFFHNNYGFHNACDTCTCGNIQIGILQQKDSAFPFYLTVKWNISPPKIYDEF